MSVATKITSMYRRLAGRHPLDERGGFAGSHKFHDARTKAGGPDGYGHVDVDRSFKKPNP
jgi:hypothetical protein